MRLLRLTPFQTTRSPHTSTGGLKNVPLSEQWYTYVHRFKVQAARVKHGEAIWPLGEKITRTDNLLRNSVLKFARFSASRDNAVKFSWCFNASLNIMSIAEKCGSILYGLTFTQQKKHKEYIKKIKEENRPTPRAVGICDRRWYSFAQRYRRHAAGELKTPQNLLTYAKLCSKDLTKSAQWKNFDKWVDVMPKQYAGKSERAFSFFVAAFFFAALPRVELRLSVRVDKKFRQRNILPCN